MKNAITVQTIVSAPLVRVWECWNNPEHINGWAFADPSWRAEGKENDLRVGGKFKTTMFAKDKSESFDFTGTYDNVVKNKLIEYTMDDGRRVKVEFMETPDGVRVTETFDPENENTEEKQRSGWQAILDNFKKYVENKK